MSRLNRPYAAFSLVELSIVLVILGLLVGGVLSGQSLIKAAQLRSISTEFNRYMAASSTFRDKYFALPGDMNNATSFWGSSGGNGSDNTCDTTISTGTKTCNGDGDGRIAGTATHEDYWFWQHLVNAGLIEGTFNGSISSPTPHWPFSKYGSQSFWYTLWNGTLPANSDNYTAFGGDWGNSLSLMWNTLTPSDTWNIDKKNDDGQPGTGRITSSKGDSSTPCTTNFGQNADSPAEYMLTFQSPSCNLYVMRAF